MYTKYKEIEYLISASCDLSCWYAVYVIRDRFIAGEDAILRDALTGSYYARYILNARWDKLEECGVLWDNYTARELYMNCWSLTEKDLLKKC